MAGDDRTSSARTRNMFDYIVSQLDDPELVRIRKRVATLGAAFLALAVVVAVVGGLGWQTLLTFLLDVPSEHVRRLADRHPAVSLIASGAESERLVELLWSRGGGRGRRRGGRGRKWP